MLRPAMPGESFSGLAATARESVGQLLPDATPQSSAWRSHLARKPLTLGAASLKVRCYDTAMQRPSEQDLSSATLLLRTSWQAAAESWWSHHPSNDNDVMTQMAGAETRECDAVLWASAEPVSRLPDCWRPTSKAASSSMVSNHEWGPGRVRCCLICGGSSENACAPGLGCTGDDG